MHFDFPCDCSTPSPRWGHVDRINTELADNSPLKIRLLKVSPNDKVSLETFVIKGQQRNRTLGSDTPEALATFRRNDMRITYLGITSVGVTSIGLRLDTDAREQVAKEVMATYGSNPGAWEDNQYKYFYVPGLVFILDKDVKYETLGSKLWLPA